MAPNKRQAIIWTNADPIHWHIYASLGVGVTAGCVGDGWMSYDRTPMMELALYLVLFYINDKYFYAFDESRYSN